MPISLTNLSYATFLSLDYGKSFGSGFKIKYKDSIFILTAKHVLFDNYNKLRSETLLATSQNYRSEPLEARSIVIDISKAKILYSETDDVAAILLDEGDHIQIEQEGDNIIEIATEDLEKLSEVDIANEVFLVGFPTSLIVAEAKYFDINKPLLRKGIVAGINDKENSFIIDCSSYYGNSGSPVIKKTGDSKFKLIGLVSRYIPFVTEWKNNREISISHVEFSNSGYSVCVSVDAILSLIETI